MTTETIQLYSFDDVRVEPRICEVSKAGTPVQLEPKGLKLLIFLIENRERLVEKDEILDVVWKDTTVTEYALTSAIAKLRKSIGDDTKRPKYIQTVHTRGYRFIATVELQYAETNGGGENAPVAAREPESGFPPAAPSPHLTTAPNGAVPRNSFRRLLSARTLALAGALGVLLIGARLLRNASDHARRSDPSSTVSSLAVLPFQSLSPGEGDEYLGAGIADALTTKLSNNAGVMIQPKSTVLQYASSQLDSLSFGRALKVDYVLGGKSQSVGDRLHVTAQLIRVRDGALLWSATFDEKMTGIFQVQDSIREKVMATLRPGLSSEEHLRQPRRYTDDPEAYLAFLKGHFFMNKTTKGDIVKSAEYFQRAIDRDPKYAMAYAGLADSYRRLERHGVAPAECVPKSRAAVIKALELDDTVAYAHSMLGLIAYRYDWDFDKANREYKRARELEPTLVHQWYGSYLQALNQIPEAEIEFKRFADFQPFLPSGNTTYGQYFFLTHQYDRAIEQIRQTLEMNANYPPARETLGLVYEQQGRPDEALAEFQEAAALSHGEHGLGSLGHLYASQGRKGDVRKVLQLLAERARHAYVSPYETALVFAGLGQNDKALECLEKAYAERSLSAPFLRFDPRLANVRRYPRFQDFVRRIGLSF
jgi:TolB-like protein/DNA-binding winged helix-turn-helix (wHTH) protein/tetratricopeptide (TPR) repeat protein